MFIQTVIQHLLKKQTKEVANAHPDAEKELSPMAQSILQKFAEHEKSGGLNQSTESPPKNKNGQ